MRYSRRKNDGKKGLPYRTWEAVKSELTNGDKIRSMNDEELAQLILNGVSSDPCDYCIYNNAYCDGSPCRGKAEADTIID